MNKTFSGNAPKYTNFDDLRKAYGFNYKDKNDRYDLTEEEERRFVADCFDTYEYLGFSETFHSPYEEYEENNGKKFTVLRRAEERIPGKSEGADTCDLSCLPLWSIQFEDGETAQAYPEEICITEQEDFSANETISTSKVTFIEGNISILTENTDGNIYLIEVDTLNELLDDWNGECNTVPANDAKVYFASVNGIPVNPYNYNDFETLLNYLKNNAKELFADESDS